MVDALGVNYHWRRSLSLCHSSYHPLHEVVLLVLVPVSLELALLFEVELGSVPSPALPSPLVLATPVLALAVLADPPKPHPSFPFWKFALGPEQMPQGLAQQACWQSASLRHWPPTN